MVEIHLARLYQEMIAYWCRMADRVCKNCDLPCKLILHEIGNSSFEIGHFKIESSYIIHPGPSAGFRVKGKYSVFAYIPDHEPAPGALGLKAGGVLCYDKKTDIVLCRIYCVADEFFLLHLFDKDL